MSFSDFVAIRLDSAHERTTEYKAMASYINSVKDGGDSPMEDMLSAWISDMIDKGLTPSSRKRYVEKLSTIYKEYLAEAGSMNGVESDPFLVVKDLRNFEIHRPGKALQEISLKLSRIFDRMMSDAKSRPELALFLYLLFNGSSDIESAISLKAEDYSPEFPQLDEIIRLDEFHHRRRYVFDLNQCRKRMPQLKSEVLGALEFYFAGWGINFPNGFSEKAILSLWTARGRKIGLNLSELKGMLNVIPAEYEYLKYIRSAESTPERAKEIRRRIAESFSPSRRRWYAIRLRRNVAFDTFQPYIKAGFAEYFDEHTLFYPQKEITKRIAKRMVAESIPVIPDVVFFNVLPRHVYKIEKLLRAENMGWIFKMANRPDGEYSVIDQQSMLNFQRVIGTFTSDMKISLTNKPPIGIGREVRITGGIMAGYIGKIYDIKDGSDVRNIYIRLSPEYSIRAEIMVEEYFVETIDRAATVV